MRTLTPLDRPHWLTTAAWPWPVSTLERPAGRIAVIDIGSGPTLLFVHVGAWSMVWRDLLTRLQDSFRCVVLDAPGCGLSDRMESDAKLSDAADAVTAVVDALELRDVMLVAHDLGGPAGLLAAARRADRIAALTAVNCFAWRPTGAMFRAMLAVMGSATTRESDALLGWFPRATSTRFGVGRHWDQDDRAVFRAGIDPAARRAWHNYFRDARRADDVYAELDTALRGPLADRRLLTVFGQYNDPLKFQPRWKALFPSAEQVTVRRGNHFPMCDDPEFVASAIARFASR